MQLHDKAIHFRSDAELIIYCKYSPEILCSLVIYLCRLFYDIALCDCAVCHWDACKLWVVKSDTVAVLAVLPRYPR